MSCVRISFDDFVEAEWHSTRVRPVSRSHPAVVVPDDGAMGTVICRELDHLALCEPGRKPKDVPDGCAAKSIETLVLIANNTEIAGLLSEFQQDLLLDVICVLIFI